MADPVQQPAIAQYLLPCRTVSLNVCRIPAKSRPDRPLALFLPGVMAHLPSTCQWAMPLTDLFDVIVCALPGHAASGEVVSVTLFDFAQEYAALLDRYVGMPRAVYVIGESFGGLIALALARLRPERIRTVILLDTPFFLTHPPVVQLLGSIWRANPSLYHRRIMLQIFGFDPAHDVVTFSTTLFPLASGARFACAMLAGDLSHVPAPASLVSEADLAALRQANPAIEIPPRLNHAGHCLMVEDPAGCVAAMARLIGLQQ